MNKIKLITAMMFVMMIFVCEQSSAQAQNTDQQTEQTDQNTDSSTEPATEGTEQPADGYTEKVTIDGGDGAANTAPSGTESTSSSTQPAEKIHIYSGKHDGNNVINADPK